MNTFEGIGLSTEILRAVSEQGYSEPTPIQAQAIPMVLSGHDLMAGAQTGTGKTAGFTLPMLERLSASARDKGRRRIRGLVLAPTRELAAQVGASIRNYSKYLRLRSTVIFGGVGIVPQKRALRNGVDILVATPGRLLDHVNQNSIDLSHVEIFVLDEADRMLDMGFVHDIKKVMALLPDERQNLLFSATFSDEIKTLADNLLDSPDVIEVARRNTAAENVAQTVHPVDRDRKRDLLYHLIAQGDWNRVLVFTRTKHGADRLAKHLNREGICSSSIHGDKSQSARTEALAKFKKGAVRALVATDIAARGLDIDQLPHVVNFDLPHEPESYVHRIGRTGRAGNLGAAVSLVCSEEARMLRDIERLLKKDIDRTVIEGFEPEAPLVITAAPKKSRRAKRKPAAKSAAAQTTETQSAEAKPAQPKQTAPKASQPKAPKPKQSQTRQAAGKAPQSKKAPAKSSRPKAAAPSGQAAKPGSNAKRAGAKSKRTLRGLTMTKRSSAR